MTKTKAPPPLKRDLANEFSLYGVRHAKATLTREKKLLLRMVQKDDEVSLRRYLNMSASETKMSEFNREQVVQIAAIYMQELDFMISLAATREVAIVNVINNPSGKKEPFALDKP